MNVNKKIYPARGASKILFSLKFLKGMKSIVRRSNENKFRGIIAWSHFMRDQSRMHKEYSDEPYNFHGIPKRTQNT